MTNEDDGRGQLAEEGPQLYEVWRIPFEFDDKPGVFKNRPVIVGAINSHFTNAAQKGRLCAFRQP